MIKQLKKQFFIKPDYFLLAVIALSLTACVSNGSDRFASAENIAGSATTIYTGGDIITMNIEQPTAESVAVRDGKIIAVGSHASVLAESEGGASLVDLNGGTLLPGFIDAHGHISFTANLLASVNLSSPPIGSAETVDDIVALLAAAKEKNPAAPWIVGWGYDDSLLKEQRHPNRNDLDKVSKDIPIFLIHVSGHLSTCNSKCLEKGGITAQTPHPEGGVIQRWPDGNEPSGVLEESASALIQRLLPVPNDQQRMQLLAAAQRYYASYGITTVQDGATYAPEIALLKNMGEQGQLYLDIVAYEFQHAQNFSSNSAAMQVSNKNAYSDEYQGHYRVGGRKLMLDGSPQGKTAYLTKPYLHPPHGQDEAYRGYPALPQETLNAYVDNAFANNIPIIAHANGDAAAGQLIEAVTIANNTYGKADRRTVMIHAQTVREDQLDAMQSQGILPSYFASHTFYWGDWHRDSVFGVERASRISPLRTTAERGMVYTTHNDTPVVPPDMMRLLWASVNRVTRSGQVLGEGQRVTPLEGLRAMTINAAYQYFEEGSKGSIEVGKLADFVVLDENPLEVEPLAIKDIVVLETIKEGVRVYVRGEER